MNDNNDSELQFLCPITAYPCDGDLSHLCQEYGCARKAGLSPHSEENLPVWDGASMLARPFAAVDGPGRPAKESTSVFPMLPVWQRNQLSPP
jgi:hypothetical protein